VALSVVLSATASDSESGIKELQIWLDTKVTKCSAEGICSSQQGLAGQPAYVSSSPDANPGDGLSVSSYLNANHLPDFPPKPDPGASWTLNVSIWAVGINYWLRRRKPLMRTSLGVARRPDRILD